MPMFVQYGKTNIDDSLHLVTFLLFIASLLNGGKMRTQITRCLGLVPFAPSLYETCTSFMRLMGQDDVTCSSTHNIHNCTSLNIEARAYRGIYLRDYHDLCSVEAALIARP